MTVFDVTLLAKFRIFTFIRSNGLSNMLLFVCVVEVCRFAKVSFSLIECHR